MQKKNSGKHMTSYEPISSARLAHRTVPLELIRLGICDRVMTKLASDGDNILRLDQAGRRPRMKARALRAHGTVLFELVGRGICDHMMTKLASDGGSFWSLDQAGRRPRTKARALRALKLDFSAEGPRCVVTPDKV
jgi:hypothetical protein